MLAEAGQTPGRTTFQKSADSHAWIAEQKQELNWQALRTNALVDNFARMFPHSRHTPKRMDVPFPDGNAHGNGSTREDPFARTLAEVARIANQHGVQLGKGDYVTSATVTELATKGLLSSEQMRMLPDAIERQWRESQAKMMQTFESKAA
jgi:hypothetical protein